MLLISDLQGLWTRSLIAWPDGRRDTATNVAWLQGISLYCDLRQQPGMPDFSHLNGIGDLTMGDCNWLAGQQGFAGIFRNSGENFEWLRLIDFQPPSPVLDIGRLYWRDEVLIEEGLQGEYIEHWHRDPALLCTPCAGAILAESGDRRWGCLLRVGDMFMYARDRAVALQGGSLAGCVAAAPDLAAAQRLVDFEISFGEVGADGWRISRSTLPFRIGDRLSPGITGGVLMVADRDVAGKQVSRRWDVAEFEGEQRCFLKPVR
jgi:hypothetical protein